MGKVRPAAVKKMARELVARFGDRFATDYEHNKEAVKELISTPSKRLRNRIAGYVTRLMVIRARQAGSVKATSAAERERA